MNSIPYLVGAGDELTLLLDLARMPLPPLRVSNNGNVVRGKRRAWVVFDTAGMGNRRDRKAIARTWIAEQQSEGT